MNETKSKLRKRNRQIFENYQSGVKVPDLAQQFFLSEKNIWRWKTNHGETENRAYPKGNTVYSVSFHRL